MSKLLLSFLGIGNYQETTYDLAGEQHKATFAQEALTAFNPGYDLHVIMTQEAENKHGEALENACSYTRILIPTGRAQDELWQMFSAIADAVPYRSSLIVDVTHGFRSQPMLALAACVYLRTVKEVVVARILYAAFEAKDKQRNITPIFDLTSFLDLIDWSASTRQFLHYGNAAPLRDLLKEIHARTHKEQLPYRSQGLHGMGKELAQVSETLAVIRPQELLDKVQGVPIAIEEVRTDVDKLSEAKPLGLLLDEINRRFEPFVAADGNLFTPEGLRAQAELVRLYLRTEQYTQAITLAREAIVSRLCLEKNLDPLRQRRNVEDSLNSWVEILKDNKDIDADERKYGELWNEIRDLRNDVNHAGMRPEAIPAKRTIKNIQTVCERVAWLLER